MAPSTIDVSSSCGSEASEASGASVVILENPDLGCFPIPEEPGQRWQAARNGQWQLLTPPKPTLTPNDNPPLHRALNLSHGPAPMSSLCGSGPATVPSLTQVPATPPLLDPIEKPTQDRHGSYSVLCVSSKSGRGQRAGLGAHGLPLLCAGIEPNPGPREDFQLRPDILHWVLTQTGWPVPTVDAFAAPHNTLLPDFWDESVDALSQCWRRGAPVW